MHTNGEKYNWIRPFPTTISNEWAFPQLFRACFTQTPLRCYLMENPLLLNGSRKKAESKSDQHHSIEYKFRAIRRFNSLLFQTLSHALAAVIHFSFWKIKLNHFWTYRQIHPVNISHSIHQQVVHLIFRDCFHSREVTGDFFWRFRAFSEPKKLTGIFNGKKNSRLLQFWILKTLQKPKESVRWVRTIFSDFFALFTN